MDTLLKYLIALRDSLDTGHRKILAGVALWYICLSGLTRITLIVLNWTSVEDSALLLIPSILIGLIYDTLVGAGLAIGLALYLAFFPARWLKSSFGGWFTAVGLFIYFYGTVYLAVTEGFFFDEFSSRLNYVAVDYLIYPHEVFVNLWETYPIMLVILADLALALGMSILIRTQLFEALKETVRFRARIARAFTIIGAVTLCSFALNIDSSRISENRVLNELSGNGIYSFIHAFVTNELEYEAFYATMDQGDAHQRMRRQVATANSEFINPEGGTPIDRMIHHTGEPLRMNVVLVLEESFGSNFVGSIHPDGYNLTPSFDSLAGEGAFFTRILATGNRTVRGVEASVASFPPIPGRSIVKRPGCENVSTLASTLKGFGYQTAFLYGGRSYFDNFGHFAESNSYDRVFDQNDFTINTFSTIWGVCDEDLFDNALNVFDSLDQQDNPFFATMITVSNHSPFTYPTGRIPFDPEARRREHAVSYADFALGRFLRDAKGHEFFDNTLFVIVADHGARVYGRQEIPFASYEVPLLFYSPALFPEGERFDRFGSQLDIAPTIMDLLNQSYRSRFFGRSLFREDKDDDWMLVSHNRDVGMLRNDTLITLGIQGDAVIWVPKDSSDRLYQFTQLENVVDSSILKDVISIYQESYRMFTNGSLQPFPESNKESR